MNHPSPSRRVSVRSYRTLGVTSAAAVVAILAGPISAQVVPPLPGTRTWDASTATAGVFNWGDAVNWTNDTLPGINEIAAFSAPNAAIGVDLGGVAREVEAVFLGTGGGSANYIFQNGTLVTNYINQNQADPNAFNSTVLITSKNAGADVLNVAVSSDQLQLQGTVTAGGLTKYGNGTLRLGTSGTAFDNAINGDITIFGGTLRASAANTAGENNPLGGSGSIVIGNSGVTLDLQAQIASGEYDFVRDVIAGNRNFTLTNSASTGDPGDPTVRLGTVFIGNATMTSNSNNGFRSALDGLNLAAGSTATHVQVNTQLLTVHGLTGAAGTNLYKRGGTDLEIRATEANFSGNIHIQEGVVRLVSLASGVTPAGGAGSTIRFGNGYGVTALDGGPQLQLRSNESVNFGSDLAFGPGVTIGRISLDRVSGSVTTQTLSLGSANISGVQLNVTGANSYALEMTGITVDAGATGVLNPTSATTRVASVSVGVGGTLVKTGGSQLFLSGDNSATLLGTLAFRGGELVANVAGSLGVNPVTIGTTAVNTAGIMSETGMLRWNAVGATTNATGADVIVNRASQVDLNVDPGAGDVFHLTSGGIIQGNATQFAALSMGNNLILDEDAILGHESHAATSQITGLANDAKLFYGISATASSVLPSIGAGTPWKGISNDRSARAIAGAAGTAVSVPINGGDNDVNTIEAVFQGVNGSTLSFGSNSTADSYLFESTTGQKVTLAIRGIGGTSIGAVPGGNVGFEDAAAATGMANIDKIHVQSGTLLLGSDGALGGVPIDILDGGAIDIRTGGAFDGPVTVKNGGVLFLNDNFNLTGTGTVTIEGGGKLQITSTPLDILAVGQSINFTGTGHTVRFGPNNLVSLDAVVPDEGVNYVISGGATAAILGQSNLNVTTNTQDAGLTLVNGVLTNDGSSRGFIGELRLNNSNFTVAATRGTSLGLLTPIATSGKVQVGSNTAIDFRDKNQNPDRVNGLGYLNPHDGHSQVLFLDSVSVVGSMDVHQGTRVGFANPNTNIAGDLVFNGTVLYLDGGGELSNGSSTRGGLTARLTDATGLPANRVANNIILGDYARVEMSVAGAGPHTITQPFEVTGLVNPSDKRTFWIDRADASGTPVVLLNDVLLRNGAQFGIDENNTNVRASLRLDGNVTMVRNHDNYDLRDVLPNTTAPANVTLRVGEPASAWDDTTERLHQGSNDTLVQTIDGVVGAGVTVDLIRGQWFFEATAQMHGTIRAQNAPARGDAFIVFRSNLATPHVFSSQTGEVQIGRSVGANGPEDLELRGAEVASGNEAATLTLGIPVRVVNDGVNDNVDGIIRSARNNDNAVATSVTVSNVILEAGAKLQTVPQNQIPLTVENLTLLGEGGIDTTYAANPTNTVGTFFPVINAGTNTLNITGPAQTRIAGDLTAGGINVSGAGLVLDRGLGVTTTLTQPMSLNGNLAVNSGNLDLGQNVITGAPVQSVAGLREHKTWGSFDVTTANTSNQIALGINFAQLPTVAWGENQTVTYTGRINIPDNGTAGDGMGSVAFAKWFDDSARITIDGTMYMNNTAFNEGVSTGAINLTTGWHDIEIRMGQGTGGAGPTTQDGGLPGLGLGIDLDDPSSATNAGVGIVQGAAGYVAPVDDGTMNLFQTTTLKSNITLGAESSLTAGGFTSIGKLALGSGTSVLSVTGAGASDADSLSLPTGATTTVQLSQPSSSLIVGTLDSLGNMTKSGDGTLTVTGGHHLAAGTSFVVASGAVNLEGAGTGEATVFLDDGLLSVTGSISGGVTVSSGLLSGNSTSPTTGAINGMTEIFGGNITPNLGVPGSMRLNGGVDFGGGGFAVDLAGNVPGTEYDQLIVTGNVHFASNVPLSLTLGFQPEIGDEFTILLNDTSSDLISGAGRFSFNGIALEEGESFVVGDIHEFGVSYFGGDGNDAVLTYLVPEPGSAALLLGGFGLLFARRRRATSNCSK